MNLLKIVGACCLVLAGGMLGAYFASRLERRLHSLRELLGFFTGVRAAIAYAAPPMEQLVGEQASQDAPPYLADCLSRLRQGTGFPSAFPESVRAWRKQLALRESDLCAVERLTARLGTTDADGQAALLSLGLSELSALVDEAAADCKRRGRLLRSLGLLGGMLGVVLFL